MRSSSSSLTVIKILFTKFVLYTLTTIQVVTISFRRLFSIYGALGQNSEGSVKCRPGYTGLP